MAKPQLEVGIYQIADDAMMKANRTDGTGWEWGWADWQRDWMDATASRNAYRCLPLTIANQTGWWIRNPVGFSAVWGGRREPGGIEFHFDAAADVWKGWISSQFGEGIITWNTPFLFRTNPPGSRLLICGPANYFVRNAHPLMAIIESDWMTMSFTMNWKIMAPGEEVRFDAGVPLFQAIPLASNLCADLEGASVTYHKLWEVPDVSRSYHEWHASRSQFHEQKAKGDVRPDGWQKDYFRGRDASGREAAPAHITKVKPPAVRFSGSAAALPRTAANAAQTQTEDRTVTRPEQPRPESDSPSQKRGDGPHGGNRQLFANAVEVAMSEPEPAVLIAVSVEEERLGSTRPVDDEWRRWIAENVMLDETPERILEAMVSQGFARDVASREIEIAARSPYLRGSERLRNRLRKRDWQLATYRKLNRMHPDSGTIERRDKLPRGEFLRNYYSSNRPVIITSMMEDWPAMRKWSLDYFSERFGDRQVEVQLGRNAGNNYEIEREKYLHTLKLSEFIERVRSAGVTNDFYLTANNNSQNKKVLAELWDDVVQVAEYLDDRDRMAGFFWLGPAGTITPFHHDLTNNFMAQVIGRKRVKIAPSWDLPLMANEIHVFSTLDGRMVETAPHPDFTRPQILECILSPGEILFLPIGCLHFVEGVDISVTMSFTNFLFDNDFSSFYSTYHAV